MKKFNLGEIAIVRVGILSLFLLVGINSAFAQNPIPTLPATKSGEPLVHFSLAMCPYNPFNIVVQNDAGKSLWGVSVEIVAHVNNSTVRLSSPSGTFSLSTGQSVGVNFNFPSNFNFNSGMLEVTIRYRDPISGVQTSTRYGIAFVSNC